MKKPSTDGRIASLATLITVAAVLGGMISAARAETFVSYSFATGTNPDAVAPVITNTSFGVINGSVLQASGWDATAQAFSVTTAKAGTAQTAQSGKQGVLVQFAVVGSSDNPFATVSMIRFRISGPVGGGWICLMSDSSQGSMLFSDEEIGRGTFAATYPAYDSVEMSSWPANATVSADTPWLPVANPVFAIYVYTPRAGQTVRIDDFEIDGTYDFTAPRVTVTGKKSRVTAGPSLMLHGHAVDDTGVVGVYAFRVAPLPRITIHAKIKGSNWSIKLPLKLGGNRFVVEADDPAGNYSKDIPVKVLRKP